ncbi:OLC1v1030758C1 [Oldenlandia corymbosa var. corymbosa]|uniref:mannan endo-1,4-beta-mannosidase n=1 Tax=Oldenlandia corymbosa var. corymbosa TaxID=529605 RepID=A0AAV1CHX6_OLDCO|nr:OLC1v1030758C1 [Oldenlandia corymbosa var. corymbosa]
MTSISTTEGWIPAVLMVLYSVIYALMTILLKLAAHDGMDLRVAATYRFVFGAVPNASLLSSSRGLTVCRTWAFNDGQWHVLQKSSSVYDEQVFQALDLVVSEARKFKIRLILPLVNNWDAYGCKKQYVQWEIRASHSQGAVSWIKLIR